MEMQTESKDIIQNYVLTMAKYEANIYVKRILIHIVNANQNYLQGQKIGGNVINIERDLFNDREYTMQAKDLLLNDQDKNYNRIYEAFDYLQNRFFLYQDEEIRFRVPFITVTYAKRKDGTIRFKMTDLVYNLFTNYTKGFTKYELKVSLSLTSVYSVRLYEMMSNQKQPKTITIDELKEMFGISDKYKKVNDFFRYVIDPAQTELDEKAPFTFKYKINKKGRAYHSITFFPKYQPEKRDTQLEKKDLQKQLSIGWLLDRNTREYLINNYDFTNQEIKQNTDLFETATKQIDLIDFMAKVKARANRVNNPKGYLINAIKKEIQQQKEKQL